MVAICFLDRRSILESSLQGRIQLAPRLNAYKATSYRPINNLKEQVRQAAIQPAARSMKLSPYQASAVLGRDRFPSPTKAISS